MIMSLIATLWLSYASLYISESPKYKKNNDISKKCLKFHTWMLIEYLMACTSVIWYQYWNFGDLYILDTVIPNHEIIIDININGTGTADSVEYINECICNDNGNYNYNDSNGGLIESMHRYRPILGIMFNICLIFSVCANSYCENIYRRCCREDNFNSWLSNLCSCIFCAVPCLLVINAPLLFMIVLLIAIKLVLFQEKLNQLQLFGLDYKPDLHEILGGYVIFTTFIFILMEMFSKYKHKCCCSCCKRDTQDKIETSSDEEKQELHWDSTL